MICLPEKFKIGLSLPLTLYAFVFGHVNNNANNTLDRDNCETISLNLRFILKIIQMDAFYFKLFQTANKDWLSLANFG